MSSTQIPRGVARMRGFGLVSWLIVGGLIVIATVSTIAIIITTQQSSEKETTPPDQPYSLQRESTRKNTATTVTLSGLPTNQEVTGDTTIRPTVTGIDTVQRVELLIDDTTVTTSYTYPFDLLFSISNHTNGQHTMQVAVYDQAGKRYTSNVSRFTLAVRTTQSVQRTTHQPVSLEKLIATPLPVPSYSTVTPEPPAQPTVPPDTTAPSTVSGVVVTSARALITSATVSWDASTDSESGVAKYRIFRDNTLAAETTASSYVDKTVIPGNSYSYTIQAVDNADNISSNSPAASTTLAPDSLWAPTDTPSGFDTGSTPIETGLRFRVHTPGKITGLRFYKGPGNIGTHTGSLWDDSGSKVASVIFSNETASGWQEATFATPVAAAPAETYTISYTAPQGHISYTSEAFSTPRSSQYITALEHGDGGGNGVYTNSIGQRPTQSYNATNYWVDPLFQPNSSVGDNLKTTKIDSSAITPGFPGSNNTGVPAGHDLEVYSGKLYFSTATPVTITNKVIYGDLRIEGSANVTITNSKINGRIAVDSSTSHLTIEDSEVAAGTSYAAALGFRNFTAKRVNSHGGITAINCSDTCVIEDSWLHGQYLLPGSDWHLGGFLSNGGSNIVLNRNSIACDAPNNLTGGSCSGSAQLYGDYASNQYVTFDGNLFKATPGAYCTSFGHNPGKPYGANPANIIVKNNFWEKGTSGFCGSVAATGSFLPANGNIWLNNKYTDGTILNY